MPDFSASSSCPTLVGTLSIDGDTQISGRYGRSETCPVLSEIQPKGDPCGLKIDGNIATKVTDTMKDFIGCPNGKWPNPTATTCVEMGSGSRIQSSVGWVGVIGLAMACICIMI